MTRFHSTRRAAIVAAAAMLVAPRSHGAVVDVGRFGAKFDGGHEDHEAINAAMRYAIRSGAQVVTMPEGVAVIGDSLRVPAGLQLVGRGARTTLKAKAGLNTHVITNERADAASGIRLAGFQIDGNEEQQDRNARARGIYLLRTSDLVIEDVVVFDTIEHCIHLSNAGARGAILRQLVRRCVLSGSGRGGGESSSGLATTEAHDVLVMGVRSTGHERAGFRIGATGRVRLEQCEAQECGDGGFVPVSGSSGLRLNRCKANRNGRSGAYEGFRLVGISDAELVDCEAEANEGAGVMLLNGCRRITLRGGRFVDNGQSAAPVGPRDGRSGVCVKADGRANSDILIENITATDNRARKTQQFGIEVADRAAREVRITGSDLLGNLRGGLFDATGGGGVRVRAI